MEALIYCRVSQDNRQRSSVEDQERELRAICDEQGWHVAGVIVDNDRSASKFAKRDRPGWIDLVDRLDAGGVDVLVVWEVSRTSREMKVSVALADLCDEKNVLLAVQDRVLNVKKWHDRKAFMEESTDAEAESAKTSARIKRRTRAQAASGMPHGRRIFGYRRTRDPETGQLLGQVIDPVEGPLIQEAAHRVIDGESLHSIVRDWKARGIKTGTGAEWHLTTIRRMLINPTYNAKRVHRTLDDHGKKVEVVTEAVWPAILDDETFAKVCSILLDPARRVSRTSVRQHLLSNVAMCGVCGAGMKYGKTSGKPALVCSGGQFHNCIMEGSLNQYIEAIVLERLSRSDVAGLMADETPSTEILAAREEIRTLRERINEAADQFAEGEITAQMLATVETRLLDKIREAEARVKVVSIPPKARRVLGSDDPVEAWKCIDLDGKVQVIRELMTITIQRSKRRPGTRGVDVDRVTIGWKG